jgi:3'-phosphoadenosine 5'-phosphosulfate sulfotransferase (PAPS reductase)/FAD synthetase
VVNVSGGKDSTRMLGYLRVRFPEVKTYCVYADTGFEHVKPVSAEQFARERCEAYGLPLHVVRNQNKTYLQMVERRGMFPSAQYRQCTSDLKRGPVEKFIRALPERVIVNCMGIRAAESSARAKQSAWKANTKLSVAGREVWDWLPIFELSLADVLEWHKANQVPLHPVYTWAGGYLKRLSCRVCIFSTAADIKAIFEHDREGFELVSELEQRMGFTMRAGVSLVQIVGSKTTSNKQYGEEEGVCI